MTNWFREQCDAAGLKHRSAHGLRKACARRLAEAGCTHAETKVTGHLTDKEEQKKLADRAIGALSY
jgi:integrase